VLDIAGPIEQDADLSADLGGDLRERAGQIVVDDPVGSESAAPESLDGLDLAGLETAGVAVDLDGVTPGIRVGQTRGRGSGGRRCRSRRSSRPPCLPGKLNGA
jgi:hypothetical protein